MFRLSQTTALARGELARTTEATRRELSLGPWGAIGLFFVAYFLSHFIFQVWSALGISHFLNRYDAASISWKATMLLVGAAVCWALPQQLRKLSFTISFLSAFTALLIGVIIANVAAAIQSHIGRLAFPDHRVATLLLLTVASPIIEEFFFRGVVLNGLLQRWPAAVSIAVDAVLFASVHDSFWPAFVSGVILCSIFLAFKRSITVSALTHCAVNVAMVFASKLLLPSPFIRYH